MNLIGLKCRVGISCSSIQYNQNLANFKDYRLFGLIPTIFYISIVLMEAMWHYIIFAGFILRYCNKRQDYKKCDKMFFNKSYASMNC